MFDGKTILITGGTGSLGKALTKRLLEQIKPFETELILNERVNEVYQDKEN